MNSLLKEVSRRIQIKKGTERDKHEVLVPPLRMIRSTASFHAYLRLNKREQILLARKKREMVPKNNSYRTCT